jgi:mitotic spindle assembly checkpoint protein MAD2
MGMMKLVWMAQDRVKRLVLAIMSKETREVLERWQFDIQVLPPPAEGET